MPKLCAICNKNKGSIGAIIDGVYRRVCHECRAKPIVSSGHARWERGIDLEDHEGDIQQPYNSDGSINAKFARLYPKQAQALFTPAQLRKAK